MKRLVAACVLLALLGVVTLWPHPSKAAGGRVKEYVLYNGALQADSTPQRSYTIPIRGASQIVIKTFTLAAATDTATTDSITAVAYLFGDSVSFLAVDSLGTVVTASNRSGVSGFNRFPICKDSVSIGANAADSSRGITVYRGLRLNSVLTWATTQGFYTWVRPARPVQTVWPATLSADDGNKEVVFNTDFMWMRVTPLTRMTTAGFSSTQGIRTRGLNRLKAVARVYFPNED